MSCESGQSGLEFGRIHLRKARSRRSIEWCHLRRTVMTATIGTRPRSVHAALALAALLFCTASVAEAHIFKIEITSKESPAFEGKTFGDVGAYEKLRGKAYGEVDPADPRNALITDIQLAPRNSNGKVVYS